MDDVSLGSAEGPYDSDMTHSYRLTEGRLIRYPCDWLISRYGRFRRWRIRSASELPWEFRGW